MGATGGLGRGMGGGDGAIGWDRQRGVDDQEDDESSP